MKNSKIQRKDAAYEYLYLALSSTFINLDEVRAEVRPGKSWQASSKKLQEPKVIREVSSAEPVDLSGSLLPGKREDYSNSHPPAACFTRRH